MPGRRRCNPEPGAVEGRAVVEQTPLRRSQISSRRPLPHCRPSRPMHGVATSLTATCVRSFPLVVGRNRDGYRHSKLSTADENPSGNETIGGSSSSIFCPVPDAHRRVRSQRRLEGWRAEKIQTFDLGCINSPAAPTAFARQGHAKRPVGSSGPADSSFMSARLHAETSQSRPLARVLTGAAVSRFQCRSPHGDPCGRLSICGRTAPPKHRRQAPTHRQVS